MVELEWDIAREPLCLGTEGQSLVYQTFWDAVGKDQTSWDAIGKGLIVEGSRARVGMTLTSLKINALIYRWSDSEARATGFHIGLFGGEGGRALLVQHPLSGVDRSARGKWFEWETPISSVRVARGEDLIVKLTHLDQDLLEGLDTRMKTPFSRVIVKVGALLVPEPLSGWSDDPLSLNRGTL